LGSNSGLSIGTPSAAPAQGLLVQGAANFNSSVTTATFLRASSGSQSNPTGGASVAIDYQTISDIQGRIRSRDWDGAAWRNLTLEANNIILLPAGNVGIGTTSPNLKLQVSDNINGEGGLRIRNSSTGTNATAMFRMNNDNSTDSASQVLMFLNSSTRTVDGGINTFTVRNNIGDIRLSSAAGGNVIFMTSSTDERMRITPAGNVGIGTASPNTKLQVEDGFVSTYHNINANGAGYGVQFFTNGGGSKNTIAAIEISQLGTARSGNMIFSTSNAGAPTQRMRITSGGNVLIGTTADNGSRLRVNGSVALPHVTKTANYTLDATDYTVGFDCASNRTATLPDATTCAGRVYVIYQYNTNIGLRYVTIDGNGSQTINGQTTVNLQYQDEFSSVMIQSNGSNWVVIASALYAAPV
jgi:hypothetical protein